MVRDLEKTPETAPKKWRPSAPLGWLLSLVLLAGIVWVVPLGDVWQALRQADLWRLALAMAPVVLSLWLRGVRWALLFRPRYEISHQAALGPVLIGLGLNAVLPGKVGEVAKVALGARRFGTGVAFTLSTVVGERLLDAVTLLAFLGGALLVLPPVEDAATVDFLGYAIGPEKLYRLARQIGVGCALLIGLILSFVSLARQPRLAGFLGALPVVGPRARRALGEASQGLRALGEPTILARVLALSLLLWLALGLTNLLVAGAMPGVDLNLRQALVLTAIAIAASAIPSVPGAWGVYEAGALLALVLIRVAPEPGDGVAFAFTSHFCQYLPVVVLGAVAGFRPRAADSKARPRRGGGARSGSATDRRR